MANQKIQELIFCQAIGDIPHCQAIVKDSGDDYLIIVSLCSVYRVINDQNLFDYAKVLFIPYPKSLKEYFFYVRQYRYVRRVLENKLFGSVYIFSLGFDWISLSLLKRIMFNCETIHLIDIYNNISYSRKNHTIGAFIRTVYYFLLTGIVFEYYTKIDNRLVVVMDDDFNKIKKVSRPLLLGNFIKTNKNYLNKIIFIDSISLMLKKFIDENLIISLFKSLKSLGYEIVIKKHPNFEFSYDFLHNFEVADNLPMELIDFSKCKCVLGFGSAALVNNNSPLKISLLNVFRKEILEKEIHRFINHLNYLDKENELRYPNSTDELLNLLDINAEDKNKFFFNS